MEAQSEPGKCPLCLTEVSQTIEGSRASLYFFCEHCKLLSRPTSAHFNWNEERLRYVRHNNHLPEEGYINFLKRLIEPMIPFIGKNWQGLDYGCGPNPVLAELMGVKGLKVNPYDPIFFPRPINGKYDFISSTEAFEHFYYPRRELEKIAGALSNGGILGIMTGFRKEQIPLKSWSYTRDDTHVCLYHPKTFDFICQEWGFSIEYFDDHSCIILKKKP